MSTSLQGVFVVINTQGVTNRRGSNIRGGVTATRGVIDTDVLAFYSSLIFFCLVLIWSCFVSDVHKATYVVVWPSDGQPRLSSILSVCQLAKRSRINKAQLAQQELQMDRCGEKERQKETDRQTGRQTIRQRSRACERILDCNSKYISEIWQTKWQRNKDGRYR